MNEFNEIPNIDTAFKCPSSLCKQNFIADENFDFIEENILNLQFQYCQVCGDEFDKYPPGCNYDKYVDHITSKCPNIIMNCPFDCDFKDETRKLVEHLDN